MLCFGYFFLGFSQEQLPDSTWVPIYKKEQATVLNKAYFTNLFYNNVHVVTLTNVPENYQVTPLALSIDALLKQTQLNKSYTSTEVQGTELEKSLRTVEKFSFPFANVLTASLAEKINIATNTPKLVAYKGTVQQLTATANHTLNTKQFLHLLHEDALHKLDKASYLRKRLLDFLVGNSNINTEEEKWVIQQKGNEKLLQPYLYKYNNQYMKYDGTYKLITKLIDAYKHLEPYDDKIKNIKKHSKKFIGLDVNLVSDLPYNVWQAEVSFIKDKLNPKALDSIKQNMPKGLPLSTINMLFEALSKRINNLHSIAAEYYNLIAPNKVVTATNKNNLIDIERNGSLIVIKIYDEQKGKTTPIQVNEFSVNNTKEIWVYGLDGNDYFEVKGVSKKYIPIKLIGGNNTDKYEITNGNKVQVYDSKSNTFTVLKHRARVKLSENKNVTNYNANKYKQTKNKIKPKIGANPDDGIFLGLVNEYTVLGFEQNPHTQFHQVSANFYLGTSGFKLGYYGEKANAYKSFNAFVKLGYQSPNYSTNFFGFGNETPNFDDNLKLDYNRVRMENVDVDLGVFKKHKNYYMSGQLFFESRKIDQTPDRFVSSETLFFPDANFFERKNYAGVAANYEYINITIPFADNLVVRPKIALRTTVNLNKLNNTNVSLAPSLFLAHPLYSDKIVLDATLSYAHVFGKDVPFYQAASIGGSSGLRGYRNQRFTGQSSLIASTNFKWFVKELESEILPLQFGVLGGVDAGRVWVEEEKSSEIHSDYGMGLWLQTSDMIKAELQAFNAKEGMRFTINVAIGF